MEKTLKTLYLNPDSPTYLSGLNALYYAAKKKFPNIKQKYVENFLTKQEVYTLHKSYIKYKPGKIRATGLDSDWQIDLADMRLISNFNNGFNYILTCVDVLSKYVWAVAIKNKSGKVVTMGFKKILDTGRKPLKVWHDYGKEFNNKDFQELIRKNFIRSINIENPISKAANVERFNRTLKARLYKHFTFKNTLIWINILPKVTTAINKSISTTHKMRPIDINFKNSQKVYNILYRKSINMIKKPKFRYNIGDLVRISKQRGKFEKGYLPSRKKEIFIINKKLKRNPPVYKLRDKDGEELTSIFYQSELSKITK